MNRRRNMGRMSRRNPDSELPKVGLSFLATIVGKHPWEDIEEDVYSNASDNRWLHEKEIIRRAERDDEEIDETELEAQIEKAEQAEITEAYDSWLSDVETPAENLFRQVGLELTVTHPDTSIYEYGPIKSWDAAAELMRELVNGASMFQFNSLEDFLDSGPYTAEEAVINHIGWLRDYYKVY
jgi:hypothetical protein